VHSRGEPTDGVALPIFVPVSLRRDRPSHGAGNLISQMIIPVPLGIADPGQRLKQIAVETGKRKAISRPSLGTMLHGKLIRIAMLRLIIRQRVNVVSADLPGPPTPLFRRAAD
jgi:diacylglycerol O-acyltransferase / wax synthase